MYTRVWVVCRSLSGNTTKNCEKTLKISRRLIVSSKRFAVEFVVIKHFGWESLHVEPSYCSDVVVYTLNCVFCSNILLLKSLRV